MKGRPAMPAQNVVVVGPVTEDELDELFELADGLSDDDREGFVVIEVVDDPSYLEDDEFVLVDVTELMVVAFLVQEFESFLREKAELELQSAAAENEGWPPASDD